MKGTNNIQQISKGCISQDLLLKYINGKLSGKDMNYVEQHLTVCPMCADELEGLQLLSDPNDIKKITTKLNRQIDKKVVERSGRVVNIKVWSRIAASLLIILALSTLIYVGSDKLKPSLTLSEDVSIERSKEAMPQTQQEPIAAKEDMHDSVAEKETPKEIKKVEEPKAIVVEDQFAIAEDLDVPDKEEIAADSNLQNAVSDAIVDRKAEQGAGIDEPVTVSDEKNQADEPVLGLSGTSKSKRRMASSGGVSVDSPVFKPAAASPTTAAFVSKIEESASGEEVEDEHVFAIVEEMPRFRDVNGDDFETYIMKNRRYPSQAIQNGIQGKVYVEFCIEVDGRVTNVKVIKGVDPLLDKEAIRIVESSPKWKPGMQRGVPVKVKMNVPVVFELY